MDGRVTVEQVLRSGEEADAWRDKGWWGIWELVTELFKLRIVGLLLWAAFGGALLGAGGLPSLGTAVTLFLAGGMAAAGASGLNQFLERDRDASMPRTRNRPLVRGSLSNPRWVLWASLALIVAAAAITLPANPPLAFFLVLGAVIYVGVYTVWLKPRTVVNIVIGGAAGSAAVMSGGAAVGAWQDPFVITLALLVFLWTPAHFWSLSLLYRSDYQQGGYPMLPAVTEPGRAAVWILLHAGATALAGLLLAVHAELGPLYLLPTLAITLLFMSQTARLLRGAKPARARSAFLMSNLYLIVTLGALMFDLAVG